MDNYNGLKEALEYVVEQAKHPTTIFTIDGKVYATDELHYIEDEPAPDYHVAPLRITTLNGFIDYVKTNRDGLNLTETLVQVTGPSSVRLLSVPNEKCVREEYVISNAELPQIPFGSWRSIEEFIITLQSSFVQSPDRDTLLKYIGNIQEDESVQLMDDGVSQKIVARTGVASVDTVVLPNPVKLRPYRTFQELEQPETEFVLRIRKGGSVALFEADGGVWKVTCRALIKDALIDAFVDVEGICVIG
jgi:hypothetical protein